MCAMYAMCECGRTLEIHQREKNASTLPIYILRLVLMKVVEDKRKFATKRISFWNIVEHWTAIVLHRQLFQISLTRTRYGSAFVDASGKHLLHGE